MSRTLPTMTRKRKKQLLEQQEFVTTIVKKKKVQKQVKFLFRRGFYYHLILSMRLDYTFRFTAIFQIILIFDSLLHF